jgi:type II secretory pathway component PulC
MSRMRLLSCLLALLTGAPAAADEPVLPTFLASELLGEDLMGLPMPDAHMWNGTLFEFASATAALGGTVTLAEGVDPDIAVAVVSTAPIPRPLALQALATIAKRAGWTFTTEGDTATLQLPEPPPEPLTQVEVIIAVVGPSGVDAMADLYERYGMAGPGAAVLREGDLGAVIVATTRDAMSQPLDLLGTQSNTAPTVDEVPIEGVEEFGEHRWRIERSVVAPLLDGAARSTRVAPSYRDGTFHGFKLFSIRRGSPLRALGVRNGDVLVRVDDTPLGTPSGLDVAFLAWFTAERVVLTVERRGRDVTLLYEMTGDPLAVPPLWSFSEPSLERYREHHGVTVDADGVRLPREVVIAQRDGLAALRWMQRLDDGQLVGFDTSARGGNLLHLVGVEGRDWLRAVDGEPLTSPEGLMGLFTALRTRDELILTVQGREATRDIHITVVGAPDADAEPWPMELLDIVPTAAQRRAAAGVVEEDDGQWTVPRAVVAGAFTADEPCLFAAVTGDDGSSGGYRVGSTRRADDLELLGLRARDRIVAADGEPLRSRGDVEALLERLFTAERGSITTERRSSEPRELHWTFTGEPLPLPAAWADLGITITPSVGERRAELGIELHEDRVVLPRAVIESQASDLAGLETVTSDSGVVLGHWIRDYRASTLPALMGLHREDIIQSFDGLPLDSTEALHDLIRALARQGSVTLELRRADGIATRRYDISGAPVEPDPSWFESRRILRRTP